MFDSGFGGLTVARALFDLLPGEDVVYVGDTGRYPYGPRALDEVREFARQIAGYLVRVHDVKMVVVACNTAAAAAIELLRFEFDVPVVGVIDPGVRAAISATRNGRVGVVGTVGTIASGAYQRAALAQRAPVDVTPGFDRFRVLRAPPFQAFLLLVEASIGQRHSGHDRRFEVIGHRDDQMHDTRPRRPARQPLPAIGREPAQALHRFAELPTDPVHVYSLRIRVRAGTQ